MTTEQPYTPNIGDLYLAWSACRDDYNICAKDADSELDRLLAQVRRDAAWEALDGLAAQYDSLAEDLAAESVRIHRDAYYPEETR